MPAEIKQWTQVPYFLPLRDAVKTVGVAIFVFIAIFES